MSDNEHIRPFSNGSQYMDWTCNNCDRCTKAETCDIAEAIALASWDDGTVSPEIAARMGYDRDAMRYVWQCGEVDWTEEWMAECIWRGTRRYKARRVWESVWRYVVLAARFPVSFWKLYCDLRNRMDSECEGRGFEDDLLDRRTAASIAVSLTRPKWRWVRPQFHTPKGATP